MGKQIALFECSYCGKLLKTKRGISAHEKKCQDGAYQKSISERRLANKEEIENIRLNAESPEHLIQMVEAFLLKNGIKITFNSYPSDWSLLVSNSHNSPNGYQKNWCGTEDKNGVPKGYPGWSGRWEGNIEVVDPSILGIKESELYLSDITGTFSEHIRLWYLNTASGGGGENFSYDGILWLYDFPKMHEKFKEDGGEIEILSNEYLESLKSYHLVYKKDRHEFVEENHEIKAIKGYLEMIESKRKELNDLRTKLSSSLRNEYNDKNGYMVPLPRVGYLKNAKEIMEVHCDITTKKQGRPETSKLFNSLESLVSKINKYIDSKPEHFI